jgi:hypothetical protein
MLVPLVVTGSAGSLIRAYVPRSLSHISWRETVAAQLSGHTGRCPHPRANAACRSALSGAGSASMVCMLAAGPTHVIIDGLPATPWWQTLLGVLGILGLVVPLVLFLVERRDRQAAESEARSLRERAASDEAAGQARRFYLWAQRFDDVDHVAGNTKYQVRMVNTSGIPVFEVAPEIVVTGFDHVASAQYEIGFVLPTADGEIFDVDVSSDTTIQLQHARASSGRRTLPELSVKHVRFTDAQGRRWERAQRHLTLLDGD